MGDPGNDDVEEVLPHNLGVLSLLGHGVREPFGDVSRLDVRHHLTIADSFHVLSQPVDQGIPMTTELVGVHVIGRRRSAELVGIIRIG